MNNTLYFTKYTDDVNVSINRLIRFLSIRNSGFMFSCFTEHKVVSIINNEIVNYLNHKSLSTAVLNIDVNSDAPILYQLQQHNENVLIIVNIDVIINTFDMLTELNFAREGLIKIGKPILFWINKENIPIISNRANDLYSQRSMNTIFFDL